VPNNRVQIVEAESAASDANIGVQGNDGMPARIFPAREANVANDADQAATRNQDAESFAPDFFQFEDEFFVVRYMTELSFRIVIPFECPIRRGGYNEMNRFVADE